MPTGEVPSNKMPTGEVPLDLMPTVAQAPTSLYEQAKLGASEGAKAAANVAIDTANIPAEIWDSLRSAGAWATGKMGLGSGTYVPTYRIPKLQMQTEAGQMLNTLGDYLTPGIGEEKIAATIGGDSEKIANLAEKAKNAIMEGKKPAVGTAKKIAQLQGKIAKESAQGSLAQSSQDIDTDTQAQDFMTNMAQNQLGGNILHGLGKVAGKTVKPLYNKLTGKSGETIAQAVSDAALQNPDVQEILDTYDSLINYGGKGKGIEVSPLSQDVSITRANGSIPMSDIMNFGMGTGKFDKLATASNKATEFGLDSSEDVAREANRLKQIERVGNQYLDALGTDFTKNKNALSEFNKDFTPGKGVDSDVKSRLNTLKSLYDQLQKAGTSSKEINHNTSPERVAELDRISDDMQDMFNSLPDWMQENLRDSGFNPDNAKTNIHKTVDAYQILHAEHPNFQRAATKSGAGEEKGGKVLGSTILGSVEKAISAANPITRLVKKPAARRAVTKTTSNIGQLARRVKQATEAPEKLSSVFGEVPEHLMPEIEQVAEKAPKAEPRIDQTRIAKAPKARPAEEKIEEVVEEVAQEKRTAPVAKKPRVPQEPVIEEIEEKEEEPEKKLFEGIAPKPKARAMEEPVPEKRTPVGKGFSASERARRATEESKRLTEEANIQKGVDAVKAKISNPEYANQINASNYKDTNFVNRMMNLSGRKSEEDIIAQLKEQRRVQQIKDKARSPENVNALDEWAKQQEEANTGITQRHVDQAVKEIYGNSPVSSVSRVQSKARQLAKVEQKAAEQAAEEAKMPTLEEQEEAAKAFAKQWAPNTPNEAQRLIDQKFASRKASNSKKPFPASDIESLNNSIHAAENAHVRKTDAEQAAADKQKYEQWLKSKHDEEVAKKEAAEGQTKAQQAAQARLNDQKMLGSQIDNIRTAMEDKLKGVNGGTEFIDNYMDKRFTKNDKPMSDTQRREQLRQAEAAAKEFKEESEKAPKTELPESVNSLTPDEVKNVVNNLHSVLRDEMDRGVSGDTETLLNSIESLADRLPDQDEARKLKSYSRSLKTALAHKADYPKNPELWLTSEDLRGLQGDTNSYAGKLWKQLVTSVMDTSNTKGFTPMSRSARDESARMLDKLEKNDYTPEERNRILTEINRKATEALGSMSKGAEAKEIKKALAEERKELEKRKTLKAKVKRRIETLEEEEVGGYGRR